MDIGANLADMQYRGVYNGKKKHEPDIDIVIERAISFKFQEQVLDRIIVTSGDLEDFYFSKTLCSSFIATTLGIHPTNAGSWSQ